jgi:alcohol dehydrogenase class IV
VPFEFATSGQIIFGAGSSARLGEITQRFGRRPLLVTGSREPPVDGVRLRVSGEPTVDDVRHGAQVAREERCDVVVGFGGGSALDAAKAIAAVATNSGEPLDYLEVIGPARRLEREPLPFIAVPTTAGTGSEVTRNAVLAAPEHGVKASLRSASMLARVAIVDPELTLTLPAATTATTGLDALTQLIEPFVSTRANDMTDVFCLEGIRRVRRSLEHSYTNGSNVKARTDMCFASLLGGLALANAGLGVVHGFAAAIGGMFNAPHGAICAAVLPHAVAVNVRALRERQPESPALERYRKIAALLLETERAEPEGAATWLLGLGRRLSVPPLSTYGVTGAQAGEICSKAANSSSMKANPLPLTPDELTCALTNSI